MIDTSQLTPKELADLRRQLDGDAPAPDPVEVEALTEQLRTERVPEDIRRAARRLDAAAEISPEDMANPAVRAMVARRRPEGMPAVSPLHGLLRERRREISDMAANFLDALAAVRGAQAGDTSLGSMIKLSNAVDRAAEEVLTAVAVDEADMATWVNGAALTSLIAACVWYVEEYPPGGLQGSPGS